MKHAETMEQSEQPKTLPAKLQEQAAANAKQTEEAAADWSTA